MDFEKACGFVIPIGPHKGRTIDSVGVRASGLEYLAWLSDNPAISFDLESALTTYLANPVIRAELNDALGKGNSK